jgi:hypothetical protein
MAVTIKITAFWDLTPCSLVDYYPRFAGTAVFIFRREQFSILKMEARRFLRSVGNDRPHLHTGFRQG